MKTTTAHATMDKRAAGSSSSEFIELNSTITLIVRTYLQNMAGNFVQHFKINERIH